MSPESTRVTRQKPLPQAVMEQTSDHIRACYDAVAREYAERFTDELAQKPLDRELLARFAAEVRGRGPVYDLGCGPGQTTAFLHACGVEVCGLDLSSKALDEARRRHPGVKFESGDMLALPCPDAALAGVVAFYAIVHFSPANLRRALAEMDQVLKPGSPLLLAFHIGDGSIHVDEFLGHAMSLAASEARIWPKRMAVHRSTRRSSAGWLSSSSEVTVIVSTFMSGWR